MNFEADLVEIVKSHFADTSISYDEDGDADYLRPATVRCRSGGPFQHLAQCTFPTSCTIHWEGLLGKPMQSIETKH